MRSEDLEEIMFELLPEPILLRFAEKCRLQERERKMDAVRFLRSMVIAASTGYGGRQADVMRLYFESGADTVVRGGFYAWFGEPLENCMKEIADLAITCATKERKDLPGWLGDYVDDWHIYDSTTVTLNDGLIDVYRGTGDYAALKIHKRLSVGTGATIGYHLSPARDHDSIHLNIDESWRGLGLLADLGYASFQRLIDCEKYGVMFVIRLKENWKIRVERVNRGLLAKKFTAGADFQMMIQQSVILLQGRSVDLDVCLSSGSRTVRSRLVGVPSAKGYCFYLTNLPRAVGPRQVADIYRVRWEIETDNKLDKSCLHLDKITARTPHSVRALVHATMASSIIVGLLAHRHRLQEAPPQVRGAERKTAPIHPQALALAMGCAATSIATAMELNGDAAQQKWRSLAGYLEHLGKDPNWRRNPSILDQLRGWTISPGRPRKARAASVVRKPAK
jgi:hypothetical protein